jgi:hypothetical protein
MANYKVIQDIEAEDKLVGPFSLRQFIYGCITAFCLYLCVVVVLKGVPVFIAIFLPPAIVAGFFATPWGKDQPTEVWALARIRFLIKPRKRIWDQSGIKDLVTVTVPKKLEKIYTNGLSENEVQSRLSALANTIDSRGWAIKNVNLNVYAASSTLSGMSDGSDRLVQPGNLPQAVSDSDISASDDMLDEQNNPVAHQFEQLITASSEAHRQHIIEQLQQPTPPSLPQPVTAQTLSAPTPAPVQPNYWFMTSQTPNTGVASITPAIVAPGTNSTPITAAPLTADEAALLEQLKQQNNSEHISYSHLRTIQPPGAPGAPQVIVPPPPAVPPINITNTEMTVPAQPAKINNTRGLDQRNDLSVATIARLANDHDADNEVVISLR